PALAVGRGGEREAVPSARDVEARSLDERADPTAGAGVEHAAEDLVEVDLGGAPLVVDAIAQEGRVVLADAERGARPVRRRPVEGGGVVVLLDELVEGAVAVLEARRRVVAPPRALGGVD